MLTWLLALPPIVRRALILVAIFCLCVVVGVALCTRGAKEDAQRASAGQTFAEGRTGAAQDASAVRDRADTRNDQITNDVQEGTADVRQAPDRSAATLAARRGVCRINPGAGPDCRALNNPEQSVNWERAGSTALTASQP